MKDKKEFFNTAAGEISRGVCALVYGFKFKGAEGKVVFVYSPAEKGQGLWKCISGSGEILLIPENNLMFLLNKNPGTDARIYESLYGL